MVFLRNKKSGIGGKLPGLLFSKKKRASGKQSSPDHFFCKQKKGVVEIQFNWIFVLIVGGIILAFFIGLAVKQKTASEKTGEAEILNKIDFMLTSATAAAGTTNFIEVGNVEIDFSCQKYSIGDFSKIMRNYVMFAPDMLKGRRLITWTIEMDTPFRVMNFLFITTPEVRYVIVSDDNSQDSGLLSSLLDGTIPKEASVETIKLNEIPSITDRNNYDTRFIFLGATDNIEGKTMPNFLRKSDLSGLQILPEDGLEKGKIIFYKKNPENPLALKQDGEENSYLGKASLVGAMLAEDENTYKCLMSKAFKRFNLVTNVYLTRVNKLSAHYNAIGDVKCEADVSSDALDELFDASKAFSQENADKAYNAMKRLEEDNEKAQLNSCSLIY